MDGNDGTREVSEDTTMFVQIIEWKCMCVIRTLSLVGQLSTVGVYNRHGHGYYVSLSYYRSRYHGSCSKKQDSPVQVSNRHPTLIVFLQELNYENDWRRIMTDTLKVLLKKLLLMTPQLLPVSPDTPRQDSRYKIGHRMLTSRPCDYDDQFHRITYRT